MNKIAAGVMVAIVVLATVVVFSVIGIRNDFIRAENGIMAQYSQNQNAYDAYFKVIKEMVQVPDMYTSDFRSIIDKEMSGRYGKTGSKAVFQWLKEHEISLPHELYTKIQTAIEAGRVKFADQQTMLLDKVRIYKNSLQTFPQSLVSGFFGFPKIDFNKYNIVTSEETEKAFQEKKVAPLKLRGN